MTAPAGRVEDVIGIGFGLSFPAYNMQATAGIANEEQGLASGLVNTSLQVGGALGLAITTAVISANSGGAVAGPALMDGFQPAIAVVTAISAVGLISAAALLAAQEQKADRNLALIALGVCALALLGSQSKTALIMAMLGAGLAALCLAIRRMGPVFGVIAVWCLGVALVGGLWVWSEFSVEILALFGKDPSLTGRTEIWDAIGRMTERKPWLGYGYSAFWLPHAEPMEWIRHETGWRVPSAHQGWLDLRAELGWAGVGLVGAVVAVTSAAVLIRLTGLGRQEGYWSLAYLAAFLLLSLSESVLMRHQDLPWTLFVALMTRNLMVNRTE